MDFPPDTFQNVKVGLLEGFYFLYSKCFVIDVPFVAAMPDFRNALERNTKMDWEKLFSRGRNPLIRFRVASCKDPFVPDARNRDTVTSPARAQSNRRVHEYRDA